MHASCWCNCTYMPALRLYNGNSQQQWVARKLANDCRCNGTHSSIECDAHCTIYDGTLKLQDTVTCWACTVCTVHIIWQACMPEQNLELVDQHIVINTRQAVLVTELVGKPYVSCMERHLHLVNVICVNKCCATALHTCYKALRVPQRLVQAYSLVPM